MTYKTAIIKISPSHDLAKEILIAQLSEAGYESFRETDEGLEAYISSDQYFPLTSEVISFLNSPDYSFEIETRELEERNWNEEWEKNYFKPLIIGDQCLVRSPFHEAPHKTPYEILINPKMAFGTGNHETTSLMIEHLLEFDVTNLEVMDMGCGTGILGILASIRGASQITGIDNDQWAINNAIENLELNNINNMTILQGDADLLQKDERVYDLFLANINRNILLQDMPKYDLSVKSEGTIILSGFYKEDLQAIEQQAKVLKWTHVFTKEQNNWIAVSYRKQQNTKTDT